MDDLGVSAFQETTLGGSPGVMPRGYDTTNLGQGSGWTTVSSFDTNQSRVKFGL